MPLAVGGNVWDPYASGEISRRRNARKVALLIQLYVLFSGIIKLARCFMEGIPGITRPYGAITEKASSLTVSYEYVRNISEFAFGVAFVLLAVLFIRSIITRKIFWVGFVSILIVFFGIMIFANSNKLNVANAVNTWVDKEVKGNSYTFTGDERTNSKTKVSNSNGDKYTLTTSWNEQTDKFVVKLTENKK